MKPDNPAWTAARSHLVLGVAEDPDGRWVDVSVRYPLWSGLPAEVKATPEIIKKVKSINSYDAERLIARLANPKCSVAVTPSTATNLPRHLFLPCGQGVRDGEEWCLRHGGAPAHPKVSETHAVLAAERTALEIRVSELEAALAERGD